MPRSRARAHRCTVLRDPREGASEARGTVSGTGNGCLSSKSARLVTQPMASLADISTFFPLPKGEEGFPSSPTQSAPRRNVPVRGTCSPAREAQAPAACFLRARAQQGTVLCKAARTPANATVAETQTCSHASTAGGSPRRRRPAGLHATAGVRGTAAATPERGPGHPQPTRTAKPTFPAARHPPQSDNPHASTNQRESNKSYLLPGQPRLTCPNALTTKNSAVIRVASMAGLSEGLPPSREGKALEAMRRGLRITRD